MKDVKMKGSWKNLDRQIAEAEREYLNSMQIQEDTLENYYREKRKRELAKIPISQRTWGDCHDLNDIEEEKRDADFRKSNQAIMKNAVVNEQPNIEDLHQQILEAFARCREGFGNRPDITREIGKVEVLYNKWMSGQNNTQERNTQDEEEQIRLEPPVSVSKSWDSIFISKSDNNIIEGFCSVSCIDHQNHLLPMSTLRHSLPNYLAHGTVLLGHTNTPIAKVISHEFRKVGAYEGLYIKCRLFPGNEAIKKMISDKVLRGFSVAGTATLVDECNTSTCYKNIKSLQLKEISLVDNPANPLSLVEMT